MFHRRFSIQLYITKESTTVLPLGKACHCRVRATRAVRPALRTTSSRTREEVPVEILSITSRNWHDLHFFFLIFQPAWLCWTSSFKISTIYHLVLLQQERDLSLRQSRNRIREGHVLESLILTNIVICKWLMTLATNIAKNVSWKHRAAHNWECWFRMGYRSLQMQSHRER